MYLRLGCSTMFICQIEIVCSEMPGRNPSQHGKVDSYTIFHQQRVISKGQMGCISHLLCSQKAKKNKAWQERGRIKRGIT